jgi:hypothetical protein
MCNSADLYAELVEGAVGLSKHAVWQGVNFGFRGEKGRRDL